MSKALFCQFCGVMVENDIKVHMSYVNLKSKQVCKPCAKSIAFCLLQDEVVKG